MPHLRVSEENLQKLKCNKCENPLSVPPITYNLEGGYFCGRCSPTTHLGTRLEIYEVLAQHFRFPCQFSKFGCNQMLNWEEVAAHETVCRKRPYLCPVASVMHCLWRGNLTGIVDHMSQMHNCSVKEVHRIKIKVVGVNGKFSILGCKIILLEGKKYLFCVNFNDTNKLLEFALIQLEYKKIKVKYRFKLFSDDLLKEIHLPVQEVSSYELKRSIEFQKGNSITQDAIRYLLSESDEFFCEIVLRPDCKQKDDKKDPPSSIPTILECPICYTFMRAPIFQCQTGHSFCFTCTPAFKECPMCKGKMLKTRNFALEDIASEHVIDCKNKSLGCDFKGFSTELDDHQSTCKIVCCSAEGCLWKGSELALGEHRKVHEKKVKSPPPRCSPQPKPRPLRRGPLF
ncbi:uncharacterized protein LOC108733333 [Agrilus planipennis]|uniref:RING-type E3 ubiquitin transferase n=1 Tax=Agrilus planipennis TaxID=224129 RepID=A0A1W4WHJ6_AGRPL|nr:uncharacterized protein LOC108733333 [Agrilus planipennis]